MKKITVREMAVTAVFTAICAVLAQIAIPSPLVPFSLGLFAVLLCALVLPVRLAVLSQVIYLLLGAVGVPVFAGFQGGLARLTGPTGGYLVSYIAVAALAGMLAKPRFFKMLTAALAGVAVCYLCGALWLGYSAKLGFVQTMLSGVVQFIPFDIIKAAAAAWIALKLRTALSKAGILQY